MWESPQVSLLQHATFLSLASKTAVLNADLKKNQNTVTQLWRSKTGRAPDPLNELRILEIGTAGWV